MHPRITVFLTRAQQTFDAAAIQALCATEITALYDLYQTTTVHKLMSQYRNAIRMANLPSAFLVHMREREDAALALRRDYAQAVANRQRQQCPIVHADQLIARAHACLTAASYSHIIAGLELLTGRRSYEVGVTAHFTATDTPHHVSFQGQAKTRGTVPEDYAYVIPVLVSTEAIQTGVARLRSLRSFEGVTSQQFDNTAGRTIREARATVYQSLLPDGALQVKEALRKIYACIAYDWFAPPAISYNAYLADILGHGPHDVNTANSYQDFYLAVAHNE